MAVRNQMAFVSASETLSRSHRGPEIPSTQNRVYYYSVPSSLPDHFLVILVLDFVGLPIYRVRLDILGIACF